jgi:hypothetical protein
MDGDGSEKFQLRKEEGERMKARIFSILSHPNNICYIVNSLGQL